MTSSELQGGSDPGQKQQFRRRARRGASVQTFWRLPLSLVTYSAAWQSNPGGATTSKLRQSQPNPSLGNVCLQRSRWGGLQGQGLSGGCTRAAGGALVFNGNPIMEFPCRMDGQQCRQGTSSLIELLPEALVSARKSWSLALPVPATISNRW